jgi:uridine phosphorylase
MKVTDLNLFECKEYSEQSVFTPENLLREARRQKLIDNCGIPNICILDPDGDMVEYLLRTNQATLNKCWACYHTKLYNFTYQDIEFAVVGCAVGSSFAVLVAEELFATGCKLLISVTSAGIINSPKNNSRFVLIERTIRDEGTSYHYLPPEETSAISKHLLDKLLQSYQEFSLSVETGLSWTTDAPFRETPSAIGCAKGKGATCVEMEAAALYAFAKVKNKQVVCFAHLTNTMAQSEGDFEKGVEMGSLDTLELVYYTAKALHTEIEQTLTAEQTKTHWDTIYDTREENQLGWHQEKAIPSLQLLQKCKIKKDDLIVDIGTGMSALIKDLLALGYSNVVASDISSMALSKHQTKLGEEKAQKVKWVVDDITSSTQIIKLEHQIKVWHDRAVFHFLTHPKQQKQYWNVLEKTLQVGGYVILATFAKRGARKCSNLNVVNYDAEDLVEWIGSNYMLVENFEFMHYTPSGSQRPHTYTLFLKIK